MKNNTVPSVFDWLNQEKQNIEYATSGQRFVHFFIDSLVYCGILYLIATGTVIIMWNTLKGDTVVAIFQNDSIITFFALFVYLATYTLIEGITKGRSLGKIITRTVVVKPDLMPISYKDALIRSLCRLIPFDVISSLNGNPWHDRFSKTTVIKKTTTNPDLIKEKYGE